jgi:Zn-finger nucleic acid-binding protein/DNA-directed RNA polymerase subunit RPC12/RpoP
VTGDFGAVELDTCGSCRGLWLDGGEWPRVFGRELETQPTEGARRIGCPACAAEGRSVALEVALVAGSTVEIDHCPSCRGSFLDSGEMQDLRRAARPSRKSAPQPAGTAPEPRRSASSFFGGLVSSVAAGLGLGGDVSAPTPTRLSAAPPPVPGGSSAQAGVAGEAPTAATDGGEITIRFNCAQCGGPIDADPDDLVLDCGFCGSWSRILRAKVADACAVDRAPLEKEQLAISWIERQVAILKAKVLSSADSRGHDVGQIVAREVAERQAEAAARRERERLRARVTVGEARLIQVPYLHEHSDGFQLVLGRETGGTKRMAVVGFVAEATEPAYDTRRYNFRDRGLRLHRGRLRLLSAKDMSEGFEGLPVADPAGVATFSVNRERGRRKQQALSDLARIGALHGRRSEIVYKPYWLAEIQDGSRTEWTLVDGQTGVVAGAVTDSQELQRLMEPPGDSPFLPDWEAKAVLVPHRCPECGQDLPTDRKASFLPCANCHVGIARGERGLERLSYSHVEAPAGKHDWFPVWRFEFRSPQGHEDLRDLRRALGGRLSDTAPPRRHVWVPARRMLGGLPGDRAFSRFAMHAHQSGWEPLDEPLPPITQGRVLGATLDAEQAAALGRAAVAASLTTADVARVNAAIAREELFGAGWDFSAPRLVLVPGSVRARDAFQLLGCHWPIPPRPAGR